MLFERTWPGLLAGVALFFVVATLRQVWARRREAWFVFIAMATLFVLVTPVKITHLFSSRYTACTIPLLILMTHREAPTTYAKSGRMVVGMILGFLALRTYLYWN